MLTIISFFITIVGGVNWLMIGLLQYDFIAGIFGYQASVFSRLIYIVFGLGGIILLFKLFKGRGTIAVFSRRNKRDLKENIDKISQKSAHANVESSREFNQNHQSIQNSMPNDYDDFQDLDPTIENQQDSLFDEHLGRR